jgi:uncharacterized membrane-anchored protein
MKVVVVSSFILLAIVQWVIPISTIYEQEALRADGKLFRFKTRPVDPVDPYRGNYLTLYFDANTILNSDERFGDGAKIYVTLSEDSAGFAKIVQVSSSAPTNTSDYVQAKIAAFSSDNTLIEYPFQRFYLEESKSKEADRLYNDNEKEGTAYAEVYVKNGASSVADVKVGDKSVVEIVREHNRKMP